MCGHRQSDALLSQGHCDTLQRSWITTTNLWYLHGGGCEFTCYGRKLNRDCSFRIECWAELLEVVDVDSNEDGSGRYAYECEK
jgi:hypothetical protein